MCKEWFIIEFPWPRGDLNAGLLSPAQTFNHNSTLAVLDAYFNMVKGLSML